MNYTTVLKSKHLIFLFLLIIFISEPFNDLFSQNIQVKPTRQSSFEAFSKGNYEQAYKEFSELLLTYSKDPLYKYYSGVCLLKLNRKPGEAATLLNEALQGAGVLKTLPSDLLFYLGRAMQMSGKFPEAIRSYNAYTEQVGKKASRELGVAEFIAQCNEKKGALPDIEIKRDEVAKSDKVEVNTKVITPAAKDSSSKPVQNNTQVGINLPAAYDNILDEAVVSQYKADSLSSIAEEQKKEMAKLPYSEKSALKVKISEGESLASSSQDSADRKYNEAILFVNPDQKQNPKNLLPLRSENNTGKDSVKLSDKIVKMGPTEQPDSRIVKGIVSQVDMVKKSIPAVKNPIATTVFFEILTKPITSPTEKVIIDPDVPAGLIYRIQIAVFRNLVSPAYFLGITPVYGFKLAGTDKTTYYAGMFRRSADAKKALLTVKAKGFKDAFTVALSDGKPVSADRASILEREWGRKPFRTLAYTLEETPLDTVPPTLSFRVEVIRSVTPLKDDYIAKIEKMAGSRGLDSENLDDGNIVYLIGKFITFESASEYSDLLIRNGYREAKVVARLGKRVIPLETAKQLFDGMK